MEKLICWETLLSALPDLYDVEFVFKADNSQNHKSVKAHKLILSAYSEVFKELFYGENSLKESKIIEINDVDHFCFSKMIDHIYQEPLNLADCAIGKVLELYSVLQKYKVKDGEIRVIEHLKTVKVACENVEAELLSFCEDIQKTADQPLKSAFEMCLGNHCYSIIFHQALKKLGSETVLFIFAAIFDTEFCKYYPDMCIGVLQGILENFVKTIEDLNKIKSKMQPVIDKIEWTHACMSTIMCCNFLDDSEKVSKLLVNEAVVNQNFTPTYYAQKIHKKLKNKNNNCSGSGETTDLISSLRDLCQDAETKDCEFKFSTGDSIKAHKTVLSMSSAVFHKMFYGSIEIIDFDHNVFEAFIQMIYFQTGENFKEKLLAESSEFLSHLYALLHKYEFKAGLKYLNPFLLGREKDLFLFLTLAEQFVDTALEDACLDILCQNPYVATESEFFLTTSPEIINKVFKQQNLYIESDAKLHHTINRYIEANSHNVPKVREQIRDLIQMVNYQNVSWKDLLNSKLLNDKEKLEKFDFLMN